MRISQEGIDLIKSFEGCKLKAYRCSAGILTIGYGSTNGVYDGQVINQLEAEKLLRTDLLIAEGTVSQLVAVDLSQQQFDALVSFTFNVGGGAFKKSTLLKLINQGETLVAAEQFLRWTKVNGKVIKGLVSRREAERGLYLRGITRAKNI
jgi:lysozyme